MATLILAILGVVLSVASLGWQLTTFILNGPRVEGELWLGFADDQGRVVSRSPAYQIQNRERQEEEASLREVAIIVARNRGRAPLTIASAGIGTGKPGRFTASTSGESTVTGEHGPVRVDASDSHTWTADLWPSIESLRRKLPLIEEDLGMRFKEGMPVYAELELADGSRRYWPKKRRWPRRESKLWIVPPSMTTIR